MLLVGAACSDRASEAGEPSSPAEHGSGINQDVEMARHIASTDSLANEKSLFRKYSIASDNIAYFSTRNAPLQLGRNFQFLGDVLVQLEDTVRAREYYTRSAESFREADATRELYENEMHRTNTERRAERFRIFSRLLADTAVTNDAYLHAVALRGAYLNSDSVAYLDSCLSLLARHPDIISEQHPLLLAMKAEETLATGDIPAALQIARKVSEETARQKPVAREQEYIHTILAQIYNAAGMKDESIRELCTVIWWTDSAYREANIPEIYSRETRAMIDIADRNSRLEKRAMKMWWLISLIAVGALAAIGYFIIRRRHSQTRHEIEFLDNRLECLVQSQEAQSAVLEEYDRLVSEIGDSLRRHGGEEIPSSPLAADINRILTLHGRHNGSREDFLKVKREIEPRFAVRLKADFPSLSEGQLRLAALIAAGVDSNRLASTLGISSKSLYTSRYRLRSALGLSKSDNLDEFLRNRALSQQ